MKQHEQRLGLWAFLLKFGFKGFAILIKLLKSAGVIKVGLAAASFAQYTYIFSWQFAAMILLLIGIHEYGHVWAMHRCGMKTKGFYFVPFFGGMAVPTEDFRSERDEAYTALMGPIWGLAVSCVTASIYFMTRNPIFAAGASWMAMINLINLLPIYPLDGGRVLKSISFSIHSTAGFVLVALGIIAGLIATIMSDLYLLVIFIFIGGLDLLSQFRSRRRKKEQLADLEDDIASAKERARQGSEAAKKALTTFEESKKKIGIVITKPIMSIAQIQSYAILYIGLAIVLWLVMSMMNHEPGAALAMDILKDK